MNRVVAWIALGLLFSTGCGAEGEDTGADVEEFEELDAKRVEAAKVPSTNTGGGGGVDE